MAINKRNSIVPFEATHPGTLIRDELEVRGDLNQKELAILLDVKPSFLNEIVKGKRPITAKMAILLEKALEVPADYWMRFQSQYEIDCARVAEKTRERAELISNWKLLSHFVPIKLLTKEGCLSEDLKRNMSKIQSAFKVESTDELKNKLSNTDYCFFIKGKGVQNDEKGEVPFLVQPKRRVARRASSQHRNKVSAVKR